MIMSEPSDWDDVNLASADGATLVDVMDAANPAAAICETIRTDLSDPDAVWLSVASRFRTIHAIVINTPERHVHQPGSPSHSIAKLEESVRLLNALAPLVDPTGVRVSILVSCGSTPGSELEAHYQAIVTSLDPRYAPAKIAVLSPDSQPSELFRRDKMLFLNHADRADPASSPQQYSDSAQRIYSPAKPTRPPALSVLLALFGVVVLAWGLFDRSGSCYGCGINGHNLFEELRALRSPGIIARAFELQLFAVAAGAAMLWHAFDR